MNDLPERPKRRNTVHHKGDARHIAAVLEEGEQHEEHEHLRNEAEHRAHARNDAVQDEALDEVARPDGDEPALDGARNGGERHAKELEALAKEVVVHPIGARGAEGVRTGGDAVHRPHDEDEDGEAQDAVRHDPVDLLGGRHTRRRLFYALVHDVRDDGVTLTGNDGLGVVVAVLLALRDEPLDCRGRIFGEIDEPLGVRVALEELDGPVAALLRRHRARQERLDLVEHLLDGGVKLVLGNLALLARSALDLAEKLVDPLVFQGGDHEHRATEPAGESAGVDLVAVFLHEVGHVECHDNGQARLDDLEREIEVALEIGGVDQLDDDVGLAAHQIIAAHALLGAVRGERVDTGEVRHDDALVAREARLLLLNRHAGPVAHVAVLAGDQVEEGCFSAVGVTRQRDMKL